MYEQKGLYQSNKRFDKSCWVAITVVLETSTQFFTDVAGVAWKSSYIIQNLKPMMDICSIGAYFEIGRDNHKGKHKQSLKTHSIINVDQYL